MTDTTTKSAPTPVFEDAVSVPIYPFGQLDLSNPRIVSVIRLGAEVAINPLSGQLGPDTEEQTPESLKYEELLISFFQAFVQFLEVYSTSATSSDPVDRAAVVGSIRLIPSLEETIDWLATSDAPAEYVSSLQDAAATFQAEWISYTESLNLVRES